ATFVNPYHVWVYRPILEYGTQTGAFKMIQELTALDFRQPPDWIFLALTLVTVFVLGRRSQGPRRTVTSWDFRLFASACVFAFRARRDIWFVLLAVLAILPTPNAEARSVRFRLTRRRAGLIALMTLAITIGLALGRRISEERMREAVGQTFPVRAAAVVRAGGFTGPIYNQFDWGGYLIWELPHLRVCMD